MKNNHKEALRWIQQAEYDLDSAKKNFSLGIYAYVCFMCEQSVQKSLKAYLYFRGERFVWEHSIQKLVEKAGRFDPGFARFREAGAILDKYYLTTRYPDALAPPSLPFESFTEREAQVSIEIAEEVLMFVKGAIKGR
jgi:HEPN domain-containing protein